MIGGKVSIYALLAAVAVCPLCKSEGTVQYTPWSSCRVAVQYTILLPRTMPSKRGQKYKSKSLYIVLLLLLAGDVELNPGPHTLNGNTNEGVTTTCSLCEATFEGKMLRSGPVKDEVVQCRVVDCNKFAHLHCIAMEGEKENQRTGWTCVAHVNIDNGDAHLQDRGQLPRYAAVDQVHQPNIASEQLSPLESAAASIVGASFPLTRPEECSTTRSAADDIMDRSSQTTEPERCPPGRSTTAAADVQGRPAPAEPERCPPGRSTTAAADVHTEPDAIPGPSFLSVSLMDVMEGVRLTQLKVDKVADELSEVKSLLQVLLSQQTTPVLSLGNNSVPRDRYEHCVPHGNSEGNESRSSQSHSEVDLLVIGDSNVRRLELCNTRANISFRSIPGAVTDHVEREFQAPTGTVGPKVVLHVGANDLRRKGSEQIVSDLVKLAQKTRSRAGVQQVYICSVTPRKDLGSFIYSRAESVNNRLLSLCPKLAGIKFVDLRQHLDRCPFTGLVKDGIHYNKTGAIQVLNTIIDSAGSFLA